jgi:ectoine hydroxylase-related dioxygenase (phytanoyl-CoA dioxygenase family)
MPVEQREQFERDGYLIIPGVLTDDEIARYRAAVDRTYARAAADGKLSPEGSMHQLSAVASCPEVAGLLDHPKTFPLVWSMLGWNVHVYHSHVDVHPHIPNRKPFRWEWHQDGGRQNVEIETDPRPRLSVKLAYWLSDVSQPGRGNFTLIPRSHTRNWLPGPPRRDIEFPPPEGAIEVTANPGDAVFFDRRIWHARSDNYSDITRMGVFFGYTYRWIAIRDEVAPVQGSKVWFGLNPVQRQLLGGFGNGDGDHAWGHYPEDVPLYVQLKEAGLLDPSNPPLKR